MNKKNNVTKTGKIFGKVASLLLEKRKLSYAIFLFLFIFIIYGILQIRMDFSSSLFFGANSEEKKIFTQFVKKWGIDDNSITIVGYTEDTFLETDKLTHLKTLSDTLKTLSFVENVISLPDAPLPVVNIMTGVEIETVIEGTATDEDIGLWKKQIHENSYIIPLLLSKGEKFTAIHVVINKSSDNFIDSKNDVHHIETIVNQFNHSDISFKMTGIPVVRAHSIDVILQNQILFSIISTIIMGLCLWILFRSFRLTVLCGIVSIFATLVVVAFMGITGEPIGILNQIFLTLFPLIAAADAIHIITRYQDLYDVSNDKRERIKILFTKIGPPCLMTSCTTSLGFISTAVSDLPVLQSFGIYAAIGFIGIFLVLIFLMTILLYYTPLVKVHTETVFDRVIAQLGRFTIRYWKVSLFVGVILFVTMIWGAYKVSIDNYFSSLLYPEHFAIKTGNIVDNKLGGTLILQLDCTLEKGTFSDRENLLLLHRLEQEIKKESEVRSILSINTFIEMLPKIVRGKEYPPSPKKLNRIMEKISAEKEHSFLLKESLAETRILIGIKDNGGKYFVKFADRINEQIKKITKNSSLKIAITGTPIVAYTGIMGLADDLRTGLVAALCLITIVLVFMFRSIPLALISLVPNIFPLVVGYGVIGYMGIELDPFAVTILAIGLGIAVDDTIHIVSQVKLFYDSGLSHREAIRLSLMSSGKAVTITSIILTCGFGLYLFSSFPLLQTLGLIASVITISAFIGDFIILPALLIACKLPR